MHVKSEIYTWCGCGLRGRKLVKHFSCQIRLLAWQIHSCSANPKKKQQGRRCYIGAAGYRAAENLCSLGQWLPEAEQKQLFLFIYVFPFAGQNKRKQKKGLHTGPHLSEYTSVLGKMWFILRFQLGSVCVDKWGGWRQSAFDYHTPINSHFGSHTPGFKTK